MKVRNVKFHGLNDPEYLVLYRDLSPGDVFVWIDSLGIIASHARLKTEQGSVVLDTGLEGSLGGNPLHCRCKLIKSLTIESS